MLLNNQSQHQSNYMSPSHNRDMMKDTLITHNVE